MSARVAEVISAARRVGAYRLAAADLGAVSNADLLRSLVLDARERLGEAEPTVVVAAGVSGERPVIVVATNAAAREAGARAGDLVKAAAKALGGGGGGKPDLAQGGGQNPGAIPEALTAITQALGA